MKKKHKVKSYVKRGKRVKSFSRKRKAATTVLAVTGVVGATIALKRGKDFYVTNQALKKGSVLNDTGVQGKVYQFKSGEVLKQFKNKDDYTRELKFLKKLKDNKNTPNVRAFNNIQKSILLDKVSGKPVKEVFKGLDEKGSLELGSKIKEAMDSIHSKNIYHRDFHSNNIFQDSEGNIKILDFGKAIKSKNSSQAYKQADIDLITSNYAYHLKNGNGEIPDSKLYNDNRYLNFVKGLGNQIELNRINRYNEYKNKK